ncbi:hypothetical protein FRACYDRAFT_243820 [Fragilariopsis cylindrus CCMP1102]|uniref:Uncharacterized protein n=1 Tax=Fragilariopsis cylindrus CCMP1102 TaxID=635003 RepID=A0A1E7F350_9STRA|nr:hypothetical protein FRACYDRAFT_243820 [Fragilariopsis cylindrus CCMP1102]|eukprot:OEU12569.1 hypothetical protein FRACYDRAFT_243820 [Fragilariopsis cylindrus CCMP1102]
MYQYSTATATLALSVQKPTTGPLPTQTITYVQQHHDPSSSTYPIQHQIPTPGVSDGHPPQQQSVSIPGTPSEAVGHYRHSPSLQQPQQQLATPQPDNIGQQF